METDDDGPAAGLVEARPRGVALTQQERAGGAQVAQDVVVTLDRAALQKTLAPPGVDELQGVQEARTVAHRYDQPVLELAQADGRHLFVDQIGMAGVYPGARPVPQRGSADARPCAPRVQLLQPPRLGGGDP